MVQFLNEAIIFFLFFFQFQVLSIIILHRYQQKHSRKVSSIFSLSTPTFSFFSCLCCSPSIFFFSFFLFFHRLSVSSDNSFHSLFLYFLLFPAHYFRLISDHCHHFSSLLFFFSEPPGKNFEENSRRRVIPCLLFIGVRSQIRSFHPNFQIQIVFFLNFFRFPSLNSS